VAKYVATFSEENEKAIEIVGGYIEGELYQAPQVVYLSQLPGKDEMRAQLLGLFEAPMAETLAVVDALLTSVIHCMDNKCEAQGENQAQNEAESTNI